MLCVRSALAALGALLPLVLLAGCAEDPGPAPAAPEPASPVRLQPGDPVPPPAGRVVLVVRGGTTTNVGDELRLDRDQLESLGTVELEVDDEFATGRRAVFSGPLVRTVLAVAGAEDAKTMHTVALNDYRADVPVSDARDLPLLLATRMDGEPMNVAGYGPTRFVYPTDGYRLDPAVYQPRWVWQLDTIEVE